MQFRYKSYHNDIRNLHTTSNTRFSIAPVSLIITNSLQVSPSELEMVIFRHSKVVDVGVVGIPDIKCGEVPKAFVVREDDSLTEADIHSFVEGISMYCI